MEQKLKCKKCGHMHEWNDHEYSEGDSPPYRVNCKDCPQGICCDN